MSQFWDTYTPECGDCRSYEREAKRQAETIKQLRGRVAELEMEINARISMPSQEVMTSRLNSNQEKNNMAESRSRQLAIEKTGATDQGGLA